MKTAMETLLPLLARDFFVASAKSLLVKPISAQDANRIIRSLHYSGKVDPRSQIHLGVFMGDKCGGAMQFGPPIDRRKVIGTVTGTPWNAMLDLNRMAFADWLPRNGESRCIAYAMRWIHKTYPFMQWVQSYADGTQCGDGTIYRASGFSLIGIRNNTSMYRMPDGEVCCKIIFEPGFQPNAGTNSQKAKYGKTGSETAGKFLARICATKLSGFQLRYIYFLDPSARSRLTVPILPFSEIEKRGAKMYLGKSSVVSADSGTAGIQPAGDGANPITTLSS